MATDSKEKKARSQRIEQILQNAEETAEERTTRLKKQKQLRTIRKWTLILLAAVLLLAALAVVSVTFFIPEHHYQHAQEALDNKKFDEAYEEFTALGDYKNSAEKASESLYLKAVSLMQAGDYLAAADVFETLPDYKDSLVQAAYCRNQDVYLQNQAAYEKALVLAEEKQYTEAIQIFEALGDFYDSQNRRIETIYLLGQSLLEQGQFEEAYAFFLSIHSYKDSADLANEAKYSYADLLEEKGDYVTALTVYLELENYKDSHDKYIDCNYKYGFQLLNQESYEEAIAIFEELGAYKESESYLLESKYGYAATHKDHSNELTFAYLSELIDIQYKDAALLYEELYGWHISVIFNTSKEDYRTNKESLSEFEPICVHFFITGGFPGESLNLAVNYVFPDGMHAYYTFGWVWETDSNGWLLWETGKYNGIGGTLTLDFYNDDTGELLGKYEISITK